MSQSEYDQLIELLDQMISDKVQLIHAGQIMDWNETKIPELMEKIKKFHYLNNTEIAPGTVLVNKFSGQACSVIIDKGDSVSMIIPGNILIYPKKWIWTHFEVSDSII